MRPTTVVDWRFAHFDVYMGPPYPRLGDGYWANPFHLRATPETTDAVRRYRTKYFPKMLAENATFRARLAGLRGLRLGCTCAPGPCHCDVIAEYLNAQGQEVQVVVPE